MYCSNGSSSMATLLQQKNCMKSLTNGGGGGGNSSGNSGQASRVLLPHEIVSLPTSPMTTAGGSASSSGITGHLTSNSSAGLNLQQTLSPHHHNLHQTLHQQQNQFSSYGFYNNIGHNNDTTTSAGSMYRQPSTSGQLPHHILQNSITANHSISSQSSLANNLVPFNNQTVMPADSTTEPIYDSVNGVKGEDEDVDQTKQDSETVDQSTEVMDEDQEPEPEIDIVINNVVCSFSVRCHLNLREIALNGINVEFRRENGMVTMKLRHPYTTASIWSSGRITCTGATSEPQAKVAARRYARLLQKLGFSAKFNHFRVVNVLGTCSMPWCIRIVNFSEKYKHEASYEPELHPGVTYKLINPKATLKIFSTGSITVTASSVANVQAAIEHIFPLVYEFRKKRPVIEKPTPAQKPTIKRKRPLGNASNDPDEDDMVFVSDNEDFDETDDV